MWGVEYFCKALYVPTFKVGVFCFNTKRTEHRVTTSFNSSNYNESRRHDSYRFDSSLLLSATVSTGQVTLPSGAEGDCRSACSDSQQPAEDTAAESICDRGSNQGTRLGSRSETASDSRWRAQTESRAWKAPPGGHGDRRARRTAGAGELNEACRSAWNTTRGC